MTRKSTDERRAQISQALLQVMAEHGYANATVAKIADEADITPGLIHYHFATKQAILLDLLGRLKVGQDAVIATRLDGVLKPLQKLDTLVDAFLAIDEYARPEAVAAWIIIATEAIREPEIRQAFGAALDSYAKLFKEIIKEGVEAGDFDLGELDPPAGVAAILAAIQGYFALTTTYRELVPMASAAPATRRMVRGLLGIELK